MYMYYLEVMPSGHRSGQCESVRRRDLLTFLDGDSSPDSAGKVGVNAILKMNYFSSYTYRCPSLYARDRNRKNKLACNAFAYKKTKNDCKLEDKFQKNGLFTVAYMRNRR